MENSKVFDRIYRWNLWLIGSGTGSVAKWNKPYVEFLNSFLEKHPDITSVLDLGCGDWQIGSRIHWGDRMYTGCDVSTIVVEKLQKKYASSNRIFKQLDIFKEELPKADLVIIKDVLQHLPTKEVETILAKIDDYPYVLTQNDLFENQQKNTDIKNGAFRPLNVRLAPFHREKYTKVLEYVESARKPLNMFRKLLGMQPIHKGVFLLQKK